jgi:hypothetical protein
VNRALACAVVLAACHKSEPVVARLESAVAKVERMPRDGAAWQPASVGDGFVIGSALRTGAASHAQLKVGASGRLDVHADAIVHFTRKGARASDLVVETGGIELESGDEAVGFGTAVLEPHGRARVERGPDGETIDVTFGMVQLEDDTTAGPGQRVTIPDRGRATIAVMTGSSGSAAEVVGDVMSITVTGKPVHVTRGGADTTIDPGTHSLDAQAALVVPADASVEVTHKGARVATKGAARLTIGEDLLHLDIASGAVALHAADGDVVAIVPGGKIVVHDGGDTSADVSAKDGTAIDDVHGKTDVAGKHGQAALADGESIVLAPDGTLEKLAPPPQQTEVAIAAGELVVIHDAHAPVAVHVDFTQTCLGASVVEVARDRSFKRVIARSRATGAANATVPAGSFVYRVRCDAGGGAQGTIQVVRDSGRAQLPRAAARTTVEMDGREYTILYQNLLPELTLSWQRAPKRGGYAFVIKPKQGKQHRYTSASADLSLRAGEVLEGNYTVWGEADGGGKSEESRIVIEFDNATPSASIDSVEVKDGKVRVKGSVLDGSTVSAAGAPVELDRHRRFETEVAPRASEDGVSIRIAHPKLGIHYFVTRVGPS